MQWYQWENIIGVKRIKLWLKGDRRKRDMGQENMCLPLVKFIWKEDTSNLPQEAVDTAIAMGVFVGANFNTVSQLSLAFGEKEKELEKLK